MPLLFSQIPAEAHAKLLAAGGNATVTAGDFSITSLPMFADGPRTDYVGGPTRIGSFMVYRTGRTQPGEPYDVFDESGRYTNSNVFKHDDGLQLLIMFAVAAGAMFMFLPGMTAAGSLGAPAATASSAPLGANGAFLGEGVASGVGAWDAAAASAGLQTTAGGFISGTAAAGAGGGGLASGLSGMASTIGKIAAAASSVLGLAGAGGGAGGQQLVPGGGVIQPNSYQAGHSAGLLGDPLVLIAGAVVVYLLVNR